MHAVAITQELVSGAATGRLSGSVPHSLTAATPVVQCYQDAGAEVEAFEGVPLFQANHLTLRAGDRRVMTPLFLSKLDLDAALTSGLQRQDQAFRAHMQGKADQARMDISSAEKAVCGHCTIAEPGDTVLCAVANMQLCTWARRQPVLLADICATQWPKNTGHQVACSKSRHVSLPSPTPELLYSS